MATFSAVFINGVDRVLDEFAGRLLLALRNANCRGGILRYRTENKWLSLSVSGLQDSPQIASQLARQLDVETISIVAQTSVDYYQYKHFIGLKLSRELEYCREGGGWLTIGGEAESWERDALFSSNADALKFLQECLDETNDVVGREQLEGEIAALENHELVRGCSLPAFNATHVGKAFGLPGFGPERLNPMGMDRWWTFTQEA